MLNDTCILVNPDDRAIGGASKLDTHSLNGKCSSDLSLHRAFSLFLFNRDGKMLLQKRSSHKFTFPMQWTNACCSHPLWLNASEEPVLDAVLRKAKHELGISLNRESLIQGGRIIYHAPDPQGTYGEHELDHLVFGQWYIERIDSYNAEEVDGVKWVDSVDLKDWVESAPAEFTPWFRKIYRQFLCRPEIWNACSMLDRNSIRKLVPQDKIIKLD